MSAVLFILYLVYILYALSVIDIHNYLLWYTQDASRCAVHPGVRRKYLITYN